MNPAPSSTYGKGRILGSPNPSDRSHPMPASGQGLYETLRIRNGHPSLMKAHFERMRRSTIHFHMTCPINANEFCDALEELVLASNAPNGWIRAILLEDPSSSEHPSFWAHAFSHTPYQNVPLEEGVSISFAPFARDPKDPTVGHKTLSSWNLHWTRKQAQRQGHFDCLLQNLQGHLTEGCVSNLFVLQGRELITPPVEEGLLPGITRATILGCAQTLGLQCHQLPLNPTHLEHADEVFLSNSLVDIVSVGSPGPLARRLRKEVIESSMHS